ncbi:MAG: DUF1223 domain-containing protein [Flavobacteriaceae bacterium]
MTESRSAPTPGSTSLSRSTPGSGIAGRPVGRREVLAGVMGLSAVAAAGPLLPAPALAASKPVDVIELFTSQGCNSCPPADEILAGLAGRRDVLALSLNVDYWDYLGWKDTLASHANTERQQAYARARGDRRVYTPQAVVNGLQHVVGSDRGGIEKARAATRHTLGGQAVDLDVRVAGGNVVISAGRGTRWMKPATIMLAAYSPRATVAIQRGENRGREITYHNVVRAMVAAGRWSGDPAEATVARARLPQGAGIELCAFLQTGTPEAPGGILAAARL